MSNPKDYLQHPYARIVIPDETGGFNAEILEFPGCFAQGEALDETYKNLEEAAESWIEASLSQGHQIPEPFNNTGYSGTISLRLPRSIHRRAVQMAERDRTSLNSFLMSAIAARVGADDLYNLISERLEQRLVTTFSNLARAVYEVAQASSIRIDKSVPAGPLLGTAMTEAKHEELTTSGR
jgi:antitoxin HicB